MKAVLEVNKWANAHTNYAVDAIRVLLGAFLFYKGMYLLNNKEETLAVLGSLPGTANLDLILWNKVAAFIHMVGGTMVVLGLLTRVALVVQFPMVMTAMFFHLSGEMGGLYSLQAGLTVVASASFILLGSGKHSLDYVFKMHM